MTDVLEDLGIDVELNTDVRKEYYKNNREKMLDYTKKWRIKNVDRRRAYDKMRQEQFPEKYREWNRNWRKKNPDKVRNINLKKTYGITLEEYNIILNNQNNRCAICLKEETKDNRFHIDHDHISNKIREILCSKCNTGIGLLEESQIIMERAIKYILKHKGN